MLSYSTAALSYMPRPDGKVLPASPDILLATGRYAAVPMINGDQEDEGTLFGLFTTNITSTDRLVSYLSDVMFHNAPRATVEALVATYDPLLTEGSPFRTGVFNEIYPGFKRVAAILGDLVFTLTRRAFLDMANTVNPSVPSWSYLSSYNHGFPVLGTFHASDLLQVFYGILPNYASRATMVYYTNFIYNMDPNKGVTGYMEWPRWSKDRQLMNFFAQDAKLIKDDFRDKSATIMKNNVGSFYV
ncbi:lipase 4 [Magnaporthiopsis poae ATCC 64411]|uniref:Lipase 4 n=1 Tax=Magnaporthiopsis poae (strain ATCC 64411 / 73-15) TaxID=644358 RepID=A0A0C4E0T6_MAGP6|nr:lipase 4 [Magnaporthiopsis poae ATCC 64411]